MTTTSNFKQNLDVPVWRPCALIPRRSPLDGAGSSFAYDMRNDATRHPLAYFFESSATGLFNIYNPALDGWQVQFSGSIVSNAGAIFHPSQGPRGTIAAGATTTSVVLTTALPAAVGINQLADRGDGTGVRIKIVGNSAAASGKTEEATITANTAGTTPTITFTPAMSFTPANGDAYEILSGRIFYAGSNPLWRYIDLATNSESAALSVTNMSASTECAFFATSELYVSNDRKPGDGFLSTGAPTTYNNGNSNCCVATASSGTTLTSAALTAPSSPSLFTNEYRNFQVRIVEDIGTPTAVGQRRQITSHTSGTTPVYTVPTWTVTPSATAKFVVELNDNNILLRNGTNLLNYSISGNSWDTITTWATNGNSVTTGVFCMPCFGITRDASGNRLQGQMFWPRGGNTRTLDLFDMTAAATGAWTLDVAYGNKNSNLLFFAGACGAYDPATLGGKYVYLNGLGMSQTPFGFYQQNWRFNVMAGALEPSTFLPFDAIATNQQNAGQRMFTSLLVDGATKIATIFEMVPNRLADPGTTNITASLFAQVAEGA